MDDMEGVDDTWMTWRGVDDTWRHHHDMDEPFPSWDLIRVRTS